MPVKNSNNTARLLFKELLYFGINLIPIHGQFSNTIPSSLPTKKYLEKLISFHDLHLFSLNTDSNINPNFNLPNFKIRSQYYSPHSFHVMKNNMNDTSNGMPKFSLFHKNVQKLLEYDFSVIGIAETKLANSDLPEQLPSLPGYEFEFVPSPLSAGGVGMFITHQ